MPSRIARIDSFWSTSSAWLTRSGRSASSWCSGLSGSTLGHDVPSATLAAGLLPGMLAGQESCGAYIIALLFSYP